MTADPSPRSDPPGRATTVGGVLIGLILAVLIGSALAASRPDAGSEPDPGAEDRAEAEPQGTDQVGADHDHVEVDPTTDTPVADPCASSPQMCGEGVGGSDEPCDDADMCGEVSPEPSEQEIEAGGGACLGELCGEIGPGVDDGTDP